MKKLYRKATIHPSPSLPISDQFSLSYLPAAILALAAALTAEEKEVLVYLLSCSAVSTAPNFDLDRKPHRHPPSSTCYCFSCYTSFWARWDSSPNHHLIHQIIDALEDGFFAQGKKKQGTNRREKRKNNKNNKGLEMNADDRARRNNESNGSARVNPELAQIESKEEADAQLRIGGEEAGEK